ncbi:MAG TPA: TatD family hydrolase [Fimbriimonadaceae bacterium]|jgi:TatD DNase family protein
MLSELFDTHCHLNLVENFADPEPFFANAYAAGVNRMALVSLDVVSSRRAIELAETHDGVYAVIGRHPSYSAEYDPAELAVFREMFEHPKVVAMGEIGLDFHGDYATREQQERCLFHQLDLAAELQVPIVFHCRDAYPELLGILEARPRLSYDFHCFSGNAEHARQATALDSYFGFDGPLTFKKSVELRELLKTLPRDRVLLETDSPYLSPEPFRGKPNEPANLPYINRALAETWEVTWEESAHQTTANAIRFFRI